MTARFLVCVLALAHVAAGNAADAAKVMGFIQQDVIHEHYSLRTF